VGGSELEHGKESWRFAFSWRLASLRACLIVLKTARCGCARGGETGLKRGFTGGTHCRDIRRCPGGFNAAAQQFGIIGLIGRAPQPSE
jgi:hypothetical protein